MKTMNIPIPILNNFTNSPKDKSNQPISINVEMTAYQYKKMIALAQASRKSIERLILDAMVSRYL